MKTNIFTLVTLAGVTFGSAMTAYANAPSRRQTIQAAQDVSQTAYDLSSFARYRGYPNTASNLRNIARSADRVEIAARQNDLFRAQQAANNIETTWINLRQFINNIPSYRDRLYIKKEMRSAINRLGNVLFGNNWVPVRSLTIAAGQSLTEEQQADQQYSAAPVQGGSFADDLNGDAGDAPNDIPNEDNGGGFSE